MSDEAWPSSRKCLITKNPCGTDTWKIGSPCQCAECQAWLDEAGRAACWQIEKQRAAGGRAVSDPRLEAVARAYAEGPDDDLARDEASAFLRMHDALLAFDPAPTPPGEVSYPFRDKTAPAPLSERKCHCGIVGEDGPEECPAHGKWGWQDSTGAIRWYYNPAIHDQKPAKESEVVYHSPEPGRSDDNATAPLAGADPPWCDSDGAISEWAVNQVKLIFDGMTAAGETVKTALEAVLAFATRQLREVPTAPASGADPPTLLLYNARKALDSALVSLFGPNAELAAKNMVDTFCSAVLAFAARQMQPITVAMINEAARALAARAGCNPDELFGGDRHPIWLDFVGRASAALEASEKARRDV